jgi:lipoprotein-releasing system ATP-binding protein
MNDPAFPLSLRGIKRTFVQGDRRLDVLRGITLDLRPGEIVALVGQSGSGKSTLLHIAGLLERPDEGDIVIDGKSAAAASDRDRTALRRRFLGFVYQYHHLLPEFSAIENVMLPQMLNGRGGGAPPPPPPPPPPRRPPPRAQIGCTPRPARR